MQIFLQDTSNSKELLEMRQIEIISGDFTSKTRIMLCKQQSEQLQISTL